MTIVPPIDATKTRGPLWMVLVAALLASAILFFVWAGHVGCYSYHFHADEVGKISQVMSGDRNYNHPLLLLNSATFAARTAGGVENPHTVATIGRLVSLAFAAAAAGLLTFWVGVLRGPITASLAGLWLAFSPRLIFYGHTFKEDTALVFGMAMTLAALAAWCSDGRAGWRNVLGPLIAGAGAGLAASGKYIGLLWAGLLLVSLLLCAPKGKRLTSAGLALIGTLGMFLVINHQMLSDWPEPWQALTGEVNRAADHTELAPISRGNFFARVLARPQENLLLFGLLGSFAVVWRALSRAKSGGSNAGETTSVVLALLFSLIYLLMLSKSGKLADRYLLPVFLTLGPFAWVALHDTAQWLVRLAKAKATSHRVIPILRVLILLCAILLVGIGVQKGLRQGWRFSHFEERIAIAEFLRRELPGTARIAYGRRVGLPDPAYPEQYAKGGPGVLQQAVRLVADTDDLLRLNDLRAGGFTHVVLNEDVVRLRAKRSGKEARLEAFATGTRRIFSVEPDDASAFPATLAVYELKP